MSGTAVAALPKQTKDKPSKTMTWNAVESAAAAEKKLYIRVEAGGRKGQNTTRSLSGAERSWKKFPAVVYIPDRNYRLSGTPEDIAVVLRKGNRDEALISQILASAITIDNYQVSEEEGGKKESYERELQEYRVLSKMDAPEVAPPSSFNLEDVCRFAEQYKEYRKQNKGHTLVAGAKGRATSGKKAKIIIQPAKGHVTLSLHEMVINVHNANTTKKMNKVIDVSGLAKSKPPRQISRDLADKKTGAVKKVGGEILPIVSDNLESYIMAIESLDAGQGVDPLELYKGEIEIVREKLEAAQDSEMSVPELTPAAAPAAPAPAAPAPAPAAAPAPTKGLISAKSPVGSLTGRASARGIKSVGGDKAAQVPPLKK